jgi:hypothetical protein
MIIDKQVLVNTINSNKKYYSNLGYDVNKKNILVKIEDIPKGSHLKVNCKCLLCEEITNIVYRNYVIQISRGDYFCSKCYGSKQSLNFSRKVVTDKSFLKNRLNKQKKTCLLKYGVDSFSKTTEYKDKIKETSLERYGVENISQIEYIKEKKRKTSMSKYGVDNFFKTAEHKNNFIETIISKYGVDNVFKNKDIIDKIKNTNINSGRWSGDNNYKIYRRKVNYETSKNKKVIFENWDGIDFYDQEYIKPNLLLNSNDNRYPSIDHKIPVLYGYLNGISSKEISKFDNLCITKRIINSKKGQFFKNNIPYEFSGS